MILKTNRLKLATILLAAVLVLTGCSSQNSATNKTTSHKTTTTAVKHKPSSVKKTTSTKKETALWDSKKDAQLKNFIDQWAPKMNQSYEKYDGTHSLKTSVGTEYPDYLSKVNVEGTQDSIGFSKDGKGDYSYNVVAIYNYDGTKPPLPNHITYFFAFHNGQPIVLVDQSRDGTPNLVETQNNDVKSGFNEIVNGQSTSSSNDNSQATTTTKSNSTTNLTHDPKMIGVMVYQLTGATNLEQLGDLLGVYTYNGKYWIGTGTSTSNVGYTIEGDTVHYFTKHYNEETDDTELVDNTISLQDLEAKQYSTADQKQSVQSVANNMPAIGEG